MKDDRLVLETLVLVGLLLCPSINAFAAEDTSRNVKESPVIKVTWNIRSGLPSPEWSVTDPKAIETLRQLLSDLPPGSPPAGWHEFGRFTLWAYMNPESIDFPKYVAVKAGIVKIVSWTGEDAEFFQDSKGLEDFLLTEARRRGFDTSRRGGEQLLQGKIDA